MHIGFDISQTGVGKAGCGYFAHSMLQAMVRLAPDDKFTLYPSFGDFYFDPRMSPDNPYPAANTRYGPRHATREQARDFWNDPDVERAVGGPDIVHSNNFWAPVGLVSAPLVYTLYDMGFTVDPSWTTEANRLGCFDGVFRAAIAADWIVAISEHSRAHFLRVFPHFPEDRIRVIYPCSRFADRAATGSRPRSLGARIEPGAFWLSVGTIEPRKNQIRLCSAYARYLQLGGAPLPLVLAGGQGWLMEGFDDFLAAKGLTGHVHLTGYVSDDELVWLYRNCRANLYPSLFEGFGLPVLEGMQFGAPTIASRSTSIPEVAGDAAMLLAAEDTEAWAQGMLRLASAEGERSALSQAALGQAARFSWERSARALLRLYADAVAAPKRERLRSSCHGAAAHSVAEPARE